MPYKDPIKEKERSLKRREYFKLYRRSHPQTADRWNSLGYKGEEFTLSKLTGSIRIYRPSDLEWNGKKVEVKTAIKQLIPNSTKFRWKYFLKKQLRKVDLFFIICEDKNKKVEYIFLIPDNEIHVNNFTISEKNIQKYARFLLEL